MPEMPATLPLVTVYVALPLSGYILANVVKGVKDREVQFEAVTPDA